ncbi:MAG: hypothetical protein FJ267_00015 [Planctomycetes bacterium]|nr:hypothetical protein [Planctomycetota bacterium]
MKSNSHMIERQNDTRCHVSCRWFKKGARVVVRSTLRAVPAATPAPFLNHAPCRDQHRNGLTLLEIIISLAIFFGAMAVLSQLAWNGSRAAIQSRLKTQAIIRCKAKLGELIAGAETLQPKSSVPFTDDARWTYTVNVLNTQYPDLLQLDVTVHHSGNSSVSNAEFTLRRWMRDPSLFLRAAEAQQTESAATSQSSGASQ